MFNTHNSRPPTYLNIQLITCKALGFLNVHRICRNLQKFTPLFEKFTKINVIYSVNWICPPPPPYSPGWSEATADDGRWGPPAVFRPTDGGRGPNDGGCGPTDGVFLEMFWKFFPTKFPNKLPNISKTFQKKQKNFQKNRPTDGSRSQLTAVQWGHCFSNLHMGQGGRPVQILDCNLERKLLGVWRGWGGGVGGSAGQLPGSLEGVQWAPQHTYLKMIPMTR